MTMLFSPFGNSQFVDNNGLPAQGYTITTYAAGSSTLLSTFTDSTGGSSNINPVTLNAAGRNPSGQFWLTSGLSYKFVLKDSGGVTVQTVDGITGTNDPTAVAAVDQWVSYSGTPTYISATSFSVAGDQTSTLHVGRRAKTTNTGGTIYSTVSASAFAAGITTVTVVNSSGVLDSGLSVVAYGLLSATNSSVPGTIARQDGSTTSLTSVAGTNTVTASLTALSAYATGNTFQFVAAGTNTGAATLNINALGAKAITKFGSTALVAGDIKIGAVVTVSYDGTRFQLLGVATQGDGASGWTKLPNGLILQYGQTVTSGAADVTVNLPITFPTGISSASANSLIGGSSANVVVSFGTNTTSTLSVGGWVGNTGVRTATSFYWTTIGY